MTAYLKNIKGDKWIWGIIVCLAAFSCLAVYSSTFTLAFNDKSTAEMLLAEHLIHWIIAIVAMVVAHFIHFRHYVWLVFLLAVLYPLLIYTSFFGAELNDAQRSIRLMGIVSFQPADLAKLVLVVYMAYYISNNQNVIKDFFRGFIPLLLPSLLAAFMIVSEDLSTATLIVGISVLMMFIGRVALKYIAGFVSLSVGFLLLGAVILYNTPDELLSSGRTATWKSRIVSFVDADVQSFQAYEAEKAIINGGFTGLGPGQGVQKNYLPHPYSDYIYVVIIEEYGIIAGGLFVLFLFLLLFYRTMVIFTYTKNNFGALLAVGLGLSLVCQALMNMMVNVGLGPVTGIPMPFVSMGGTSLAFSGLSVGIIQSVSRYGRQRKTKQRIIRKNFNPRIAVS